jgi:hypothetical protein
MILYFIGFHIIRLKVFHQDEMFFTNNLKRELTIVQWIR